MFKVTEDPGSLSKGFNFVGGVIRRTHTELG